MEEEKKELNMEATNSEPISQPTPAEILGNMPAENLEEVKVEEEQIVDAIEEQTDIVGNVNKLRKKIEEKGRFYAVNFNDVEEHMMQILITRKGYRASDVLRTGMRLLYRKEFPLYALANKRRKVLASDSMASLEAVCKEQGGKLVKGSDGVYKCRVKKGKLQYDIVV